ncbi:MAG TPA: DUF2585 family protein [Sphingomicrobium sp.]|jgi:hypothetical protein|nr:DUF2585 family protein [Sphingomicrobium sp.]
MAARRALGIAFLIIAAAAAIELAMGRHAICTCGSVDLWVGSRDSPRTSQMIADWYSLSHVVHGFLFYVLLWLVLSRWPFHGRLLVAVAIEAAWEVIENTPMVIDRYRETTAALGYSGDSVINSVSDILMMGLGFVAARKLPVWASIALVLALELIPLFAIRDNLALNIVNLLAPSAALQAWQAH